MRREKRKKVNKTKLALVTVIVVMVVALIVLGTKAIKEEVASKNEMAKSELNITEENMIENIEGNNEISNEVNGIAENTTNENQTSNEATSQTSTGVTQTAQTTKPNNNSNKVNDNSGTTTQTSTTPKYTNSGKGGLPVLMYHFFYDAAAGQTGKDNNFMEISAFESQMKYLSDNNFYFPTWPEVEAYIDGNKSLPDKSVVITVDDGDESFFKLALPVIEKYNVKATEFLVTSWNGWYCNDYKSSKMSYQSHSDNMHKGGANGKGVLLSWTYDQIYQDLIDSKNVLNGEATVFCYPFGQYNEYSKKILKDAGYKLAFTTQGGRVYKGADKYALPRVRMSKGVSLQSFASMVN